jgi:hypothetical protein
VRCECIAVRGDPVASGAVNRLTSGCVWNGMERKENRAIYYVHKLAGLTDFYGTKGGGTHVLWIDCGCNEIRGRCRRRSCCSCTEVWTEAEPGVEIRTAGRATGTAGPGGAAHCLRCSRAHNLRSRARGLR